MAQAAFGTVTRESGLISLLVLAAAAPAATVTATKSVARGCQAKFVGDRASTDAVRATARAKGLLRVQLTTSTADARDHSLIRGRAPNGWTLRLHKSFMPTTSPIWQDDYGIEVGDPILFPDALDYRYRSKGGRFEWHVNPSTRPYVAGRWGRDPVAPPQAEIALPNPAGIPAENQNGDYSAGAYESIPFTVGGPPEVDNGRTPLFYGPKEAWQLSCVDRKGRVRATRNLVVDRGHRVNVGNVCSSGALARAKAAG